MRTPCSLLRSQTGELEFETCADELNWAHGKTSSREFGKMAARLELSAENDEEQANVLCRHAEEARVLEAAWVFDSYTNPLLDRLERQNARRLLKPKTPRRKVQR